MAEVELNLMHSGDKNITVHDKVRTHMFNAIRTEVPAKAHTEAYAVAERMSFMFQSIAATNGRQNYSWNAIKLFAILHMSLSLRLIS